MSQYKPPPLSELSRRQVQWIVGGAALTLATMPGQTNFIAQFNTSLRETFGLSHGEFGGLYTIATLASAFLLIWAGMLVDRYSARKLAIASIAGLALTAVAMSGLGHVALLVVALACLRFFGQGMLAHISATTMARWFNRFRGRALSFAGLGFTIGEASLPFTITLAIAAFGWRTVSPLSHVLTGQNWTRSAVLRDPLFYAIIFGIMAPPAIGTLFIFHQAHLTALKGWDLIVFTAFFPFLSVTTTACSLLAGFLVDTFGAWRLMPIVLLPLALACLIVGTLQSQWVIPLIFVSFGLTQGLMNPIVGSLWVEVYGTAHVGAIRSLAIAALVAASALGPGMAGFLIDVGVELDLQAFGYAAYCVGGALVYVLLQSRLGERVAALP